MKKLAIIIAFVLVVCTVAGCTTTTNNPSQTPSATPSASSNTTTHDVFLENYLTAYKNVSYSDRSLRIKAWDLAWINSTSAHLQWTFLNKTNKTVNRDETFLVFSTTQDATNYLNTLNKTAYSLVSTEYDGGAYQNATGHAPQIFKKYVWTEGNQSNISEYRIHQIGQLDNIVIVAAVKVLS